MPSRSSGMSTAGTIACSSSVAEVDDGDERRVERDLLARLHVPLGDDARQRRRRTASFSALRASCTCASADFTLPRGDVEARLGVVERVLRDEVLLQQLLVGRPRLLGQRQLRSRRLERALPLDELRLEVGGVDAAEHLPGLTASPSRTVISRTSPETLALTVAGGTAARRRRPAASGRAPSPRPGRGRPARTRASPAARPCRGRPRRWRPPCPAAGTPRRRWRRRPAARRRRRSGGAASISLPSLLPIRPDRGWRWRPGPVRRGTQRPARWRRRCVRSGCCRLDAADRHSGFAKARVYAGPRRRQQPHATDRRRRRRAAVQAPPAARAGGRGRGTAPARPVGGLPRTPSARCGRLTHASPQRIIFCCLNSPPVFIPFPIPEVS